MALVLLICGGAAAVFGAALYDPRAAVIVVGVLLMLAGVDLERPDRGGS